MKKIIYTFLVLLVLWNSIFIANFLWTHYSGVPLFWDFERGYNIWNSLYKSEQYEIAAASYELTAEKYNRDYELFHNLWNTQYKLGNLESAIENYESALEIQAHPETQKNLEFVQNKLKNLEQEQQEQWENQEWEESGWEENSDSQEQNPHPPSGTSPWQEEENKNGWEEQWLSEQTQAILEKRAEDLEQAQEDFKKHYNQNYKQDNSNNLLERIFNNSLLDQTEQKDW